MGGETIAADWVISAADGHATIYDLLGGKYTNKATEKIYDEFETFPSYLQVSLGVALDLSQQPAFVTRVLDTPLRVGPRHTASAGLLPLLSLRPNLRASRQDRGHLLFPTRNFEYWVHLQQQDAGGYRAEKQRIAEAVITLLEGMVPDDPPGDRGGRRLNARDRYPLHRQLEGKHGRLAPDTQYRVPAIAEHLTRFAAVPDGGSMGHAGRWAAVGPVDGALRYSGRVPTRSDTFRGTQPVMR